MDKNALFSVRAKKLGIMLRGARSTYCKSSEDCAAALGVPVEVYEQFERGEQSPSLPQLELFAYFLQIPMDYFWEDHTPDQASPNLSQFNLVALLNVRNRVIGAMLRKQRLERALSANDLADKLGLKLEQYQAYETGRQAIPVTILESFCEALGNPVSVFQDDHGPVGTFFMQERSARGFKELTPELQKFVVQPVNRPYLELAKRLSEMDVNKLRSVAEGLLEITL